MKSRKQLKSILERALIDALTRLKLPKSSKKVRKAAAKAAARLSVPIRKELRKMEKRATAVKKKAKGVVSKVRRRVNRAG